MDWKSETREEITRHIFERNISFVITAPEEDYVTPAIKAFVRLCADQRVNRVLIVASKLNIVNKWLAGLKREPSRTGLSYASALGKADQKKMAFFSEAKIVLTNDESLQWIKDVTTDHNTMLIIDEISRYRHFKSERYQIIRRIAQDSKHVTAFSRLPIPQGLQEIWEEMFILDGGLRLGTSKMAFWDRYFFVNCIMVNDHKKYYFIPKESSSKMIARAISDICLNILDYLGSEDGGVIRRNIYVQLSSSEMSRYHLMAREALLEFEDNSSSDLDVSATAGKLIQLASGTIYDDNKGIVEFHDRKIDALRNLLKEYPNRNILIAYWYKHELLHVMKAFPCAKAILTPKDVADWNRGNMRIGLVNSSMGGRLGDVSGGGNILIWFSLTWSLGQYARTNDRIKQTKGYSIIFRLIATDTIDETVIKVLETNRKDNALLLGAIRGSADGKKKNG